MYKLELYVPQSHLETLKKAIFKAGAGRIGSYDGCSWQVDGLGQFTPRHSAHPFTGEVDVPTVVAEVKLECVVSPVCLHAVLAALKESHPYEVPAYAYWPIMGSSL